VNWHLRPKPWRYQAREYFGGMATYVDNISLIPESTRTYIRGISCAEHRYGWKVYGFNWQTFEAESMLACTTECWPSGFLGAGDT